MIPPDRQQLEANGEIQEPTIAANPAKGHQDPDFPEHGSVNQTRSREVERLPLLRTEPFRTKPRPKEDMGVDENGDLHSARSTALMTSSGSETSSARGDDAGAAGRGRRPLDHVW